MPKTKTKKLPKLPKRAKVEKPHYPPIFPDDHPHVVALAKESARLRELSEKMALKKRTNLISVAVARDLAWAHNMSSAWLRAYLALDLEKT